MSDIPNTDPTGQEPGKSNGSMPPPSASEAARIADLDREAKELLHPSPSALTVTGHMTVIPVVSKPLPHEFFRTHPVLRFSMPMVTPKKGALGAHTYAVMPTALPYLAREMIEPFMATLFLIVIAARPLIYKLILVKTPSDPLARLDLKRKIISDIRLDYPIYDDALVLKDDLLDRFLENHGIPAPRTPTGKPSSSADALGTLARDYPILGPLNDPCAPSVS